MKGKRVASTSTSDLSEAGIERFVSDALELAELSQEDPFAGPADPKLLCDPSKAPDFELYDPKGGGSRRGGGDRDREARRRRGARVRQAHHEQRGRDVRANGGRRGDRSLERVSRGVRRLVLVAERRARRRGRGRKEAPRLPLDGEALLRRARSRRRRRPRSRAAHAAQARRAHRRDVRGARRVRSGRGAIDPRTLGELHDRQLDLAQIELPHRPRGHARRERSRHRHRRSAHPARARLASVRRRRPREPQERRRRKGNAPHVSLRQLLRAQARRERAPETHRAAAARASARARRTSSSSLEPTRTKRS